jgi:hypothetical protein
MSPRRCRLPFCQLAAGAPTRRGVREKDRARLLALAAAPDIRSEIGARPFGTKPTTGGCRRQPATPRGFHRRACGRKIVSVMGENGLSSREIGTNPASLGARQMNGTSILGVPVMAAARSIVLPDVSRRPCRTMLGRRSTSSTFPDGG